MEQIGGILDDRLPTPQPDDFDSDEEYVAALQVHCEKLEHILTNGNLAAEIIREFNRFRLDSETEVPRAIDPIEEDLRNQVEALLRSLVFRTVQGFKERGEPLSEKLEARTVMTALSQMIEDRYNDRPGELPNLDRPDIILAVFRLSNLRFWNRFGKNRGNQLLRKWAELVNMSIARVLPTPARKNAMLDHRAVLYRGKYSDDAHFSLVVTGNNRMTLEIIGPPIKLLWKEETAINGLQQPRINYGVTNVREALKFFTYYAEAYPRNAIPSSIPEQAQLIVHIMYMLARLRLLLAFTRSQLARAALLMAEDENAYCQVMPFWADDEIAITMQDVQRLASADRKDRHNVLNEIMDSGDMRRRIRLLDECLYYDPLDPTEYMLQYHVRTIVSRLPYQPDINRDERYVKQHNWFRS